MSDLSSQLLIEWRSQVIQNLNTLADNQKEMMQRFSLFESTFARESRLEKIIEEQKAFNDMLQARISKLESIYMKALGAGFVIQILFAVLVAFIKH